MKAGDIILVRGRGWASSMIRSLTRAPEEGVTRVTHCALAVDGTRVVEAVFPRGVVIQPYSGGEVWRPKNIPEYARRQIVGRALCQVGRPYGWGKIMLHAADGVLGGAYIFRRFAHVDRWPICSWLVAQSYASEGYMFGVDARAATPDDIDDYVRENPHKYENVNP